MDIVSLEFVVLIISTALILYMLTPKYKMPYLALLSAGFVAWLSVHLLTYVLIYTLINYYIGIKMPDSGNKKLLFRIGLVINVSQLIVMRYSSFAIDPILHLFNSSFYLNTLAEYIVPIGISYFTIQGVGYLFNVKMGWEKPEKNFLHFWVYLSFFPKFISGPIERSNHFLPQLKQTVPFNMDKVTEGMIVMLIGFFKKVAIANQLAPYVQSTFANLDGANGYSLCILLLLLPLYLYFDFSGYTDIAIGGAKMFGIDLLPNFNRPFFAENMTSFWKRFHISLSSWFNDYVFKQTSFRRRKWGIYGAIYAVVLTWVLFGVWHGAGWNFMLLGVLQAIAIVYEYLSRRWRMLVFSKMPGYLRKGIGRVVVYVFYGTSLVFFFSPNLESTILLFSKLFTFNGSLYFVFLELIQQISLSVLVFIFVMLLIEWINEDFKPLSNRIARSWQSDRLGNTLFRWTVFSLMLTILFVLGNNVQQFIYSQF
ncbi:MBOAT family O-acyltransferase [Saccharicrinis sp. GN24d3]|uniref:MBOAT family O-acyltransferase n=1 Tax=Saccharicrinis sp. GN24d3 TaxID=3458416 RepID=UPI004036FB1C